MGQLIIGLGGAVVASFLPPGFSQLATIGFGLLGNILFPPDPIRIEGPRKGDLRVSSSTYGRPIPEGFGTFRLATNMIWSTPGGIRETPVVTQVGGKGSLAGPTGEQITYTYDVDCAFLISQGPAEAVLRIWANGKKIYDVRDPATTSAEAGFTQKPGLSVRIYLGTEDQLRDPTIEAAEGTDNTSAFRGSVYIVFDKLDLTDFGRSIPQITVEVAFKATQVDAGIKSTDIDSPLLGGGAPFPDYKRDIIWTFDSGGGGDGTDVGIRQYSMNTLSEIRQVTAAEMGTTRLDWDSNDRFVVGRHTGRLYIGHTDNSMEIDIIDPDTLRKIGSVGTFGGSGDFNHALFSCDPAQPDIAGFAWFEEFTCFAPSSTPGAELQKIFLIGHGLVTDGPFLLDVTDPSNTLAIVWQNGSLPSAQSLRGTAEPPGIGEAVLWEIHQGGTGNATASLFKWTVQFNAELEVVNPSPCTVDFDGVTWELAATFPSSVWDDDGGSGFIQGPIYDETDSTVIFWHNTHVWKWDPATGTILWNTHVTAFGGSIGIVGQHTRVRGGRLGFTTGVTPGTYFIIDTITGEVIETSGTLDADTPGGWWALRNYFWDETFGCFYSEAQNSIPAGAPEALERFCVGRKTGLGEPLSDVVEHLSGENINGAGLTASEIDVTDLVPFTVRGYGVTREMPSKQAIEPLMLAFDFDAAEIDDSMEFVLRNSTSIATITQQDILAASPLITERRIQEVELPSSFGLTYMDLDRDYQDNIARAKRFSAPIPTMFSRHEQTIDLAIVFTGSESKEIIERVLYTAWAQRTTLGFGLTNEFIRLVPTSVVTLILDSGTTFLLRIVAENVGINQTQRYEAVIQEAVLQVASGATADPNLGFQESQIPTSELARLCLIDAPYLRDVDTTLRGSIELKYAMAGFKAGWKAGTLWGSDDGFNYDQIGRVTAPKTYGLLTNKLPTGFENLTDRSTVLNVAMIEGDLQSVTDAQFIAQDQVAIIGSVNSQNWEYVSFRDAVQRADSTWDVSHLRRGRRGTDTPTVTETHGLGELFIVADRSYIERILLTLSDLNLVRFYRGVGRNTLLELAETIPLASTGGPLRPFRPHQLKASVDGSDNIDVTFNRSNRLNYELTGTQRWDGGPLDEDTESYDLVILDQPGGSDVRTINGTTESIQYDKADIITDLAVGTGATTLDVGSVSTFTRVAGSFVTDGFLVGQTIESKLFTDGANIGIFTVAVVAAATLTIEEAALVVESGTGDEEIDAIRGPDLTFRVHQRSAQVGQGYASEEATRNL